MNALVPALALLAALVDAPVVDRAGVIPVDVVAEVTRVLREARASGACDLRVMTVESLEGRPIEEFALSVAEDVGIGSDERDDGVLLLIAVEDREMRIETGRGVEATLTDAHCFEITREILRPRLREGAYGDGVRDAVAAILGTFGVEGLEPAAVPDPRDAVVVHIPGWRWWSVLAGAFALALLLRGIGVPVPWSWTSLWVAFPVLPAVHQFGSDRALDLASAGCFAFTAMIWLVQNPRVASFREHAGEALEWMFDRVWMRPLAHVVAFPIWVLRILVPREPFGYGYWIRRRGFQWRFTKRARWTTVGWWSAFVGVVLAVLGTGATGGALIAGLFLVALPLHGLACGVAALVAAGFEGRLRSSGRGSSSVGSTRDDDWHSNSSSSSGSDSGGAFDGGGASDSW